MEPLSILSSVSGLLGTTLQATQLVTRLVTNVKDVPKEIVQLRLELIILSDTVLALQELMLNSDQWGPLPANMMTALETCGSTIRDLALKLDRSYQSITTTSKRFRRSIFKEKEMRETTEQFKSLQTTLLLYIQIVRLKHQSTSESKRNQRVQTLLLDESPTQIDPEPRGLSRTAELANDRHSDLLQWLSPYDHSYRHNVIVRDRVEGTGRWILKTASYSEWKTRRARTFLHFIGPPGVGKTVLASVIIDDLTQCCGKDSRLTGLAYVYCDFRDPANYDRIAASILKQLLLLLETLPPLIHDRFERLKSMGKRIQSSELTRLIYDIAAKFSCLHLVIDALDELDTDAAINVVVLLQQLHSRGFNVLTLSRTIHLTDVPSSELVSVRITADRRDVEAYLRKRIESSQCRDLVVGDFKQKMISLMTDKTDGGFLMAVLHIYTLLEEAITRNDIWKGLANLPATLDETYSRTLNSINGQSERRRSFAQGTLTWLLHSKRALSMQELCEALSVRPHSLHHEIDDVPTPQAVVKTCMGLVTINQYSMVSLAHVSVKDFLSRSTQSEDWLLLARERIAITCLTYLRFRDFVGDPCGQREDLDSLEDYAFLSYALRYWDVHLKDLDSDKLSTSTSTLIWDMKLALLRNPASSKWLYALELQLDDATVELPQISAQPPTSLHICARYDFAEEMLALLEENPQLHDVLDSKDWSGATPLCKAARSNGLRVTKLLLERGADVSVGDDEGSTALHYAAYWGSSEVLNLLLDRALDVNLPDTLGMTPLLLAVYQGRRPAILQLLNHGADLSARTKYDSLTALQLATDNGEEDLVQFLLHHDANIDAKDAKGRTALFNAVPWASDKMVKALLTYGASINILDTEGLTPLHLAALHGRRTFVKLFIANGADVNAQDVRGRTPLMEAVTSGSLETVNTLLDRWANVDTSSAEGSTALHQACQSGQVAIVKTLLSHGADTAIKDSQHRIAEDYAETSELVEAFANGGEVFCDSEEELPSEPIGDEARIREELLAKLKAI